MTVTAVLLDILVVLLAAKVAAEASERLGLPAVVGEIVAGVVIGQSALGLVGSDDVVRVLGQLGVILLLLDVGMQMDLAELWAVGRASVLVACVGVVVPMILGLLVADAFGYGSHTSLFVGAALTATSVGITARVFGDLGALASPEARTVLGAAVADDVIGLVILTVVVRIVAAGSVSPLGVSRVVGVAIGFLVVASVVGLKIAPPLFAGVNRWSRSAGTMIGLALAFTLGVAELAQAAKLAPIVGAFVAGLALGRAHSSDRIRRELTPVGHLLIPVFFLQIGIDARLSEFARPSVIGLAAVLLAVAVVGKLVSPLGAIGSPGDKLLIGIGMIPRGEVGLIFATLGLQNGILKPNLYAAVLLVVLATTLITPPVLRWRLERIRGGQRPATAEPMPRGGWWELDDTVVDLAATPPSHLALSLALEGALLVRQRRPGPRLFDWFSSQGSTPLPWDPRATRQFLSVLTEGDARSWRFLDVIGVLNRALPELAEAVHSRETDTFELDPSHPWRWSLVEQVRDQARGEGAVAEEHRLLRHPQWLLLAALILETAADGTSAVAIARRLAGRLELGAAAEQELAMLVGDSDLLAAASARVNATGEQPVLQLASHLDRPEWARALYLLTLARTPLEPVQRARLDLLYRVLQQALERSDLTSLDARNLLEARRSEAERLAQGSSGAIQRIRSAPRALLVSQRPDMVARAAGLVAQAVERHHRSVDIATMGDAGWQVEVAGRDTPGLLAAVAGLLGDLGFDVERAFAATWEDRFAYELLVVTPTHSADGHLPAGGPDPEAIRSGLGHRLTEAGPRLAVPGAVLSFDDAASPWYTLCRVRAERSDGVLHRLALATFRAGADIQAATLTPDGTPDLAEFELTDRSGAKLQEEMKQALRREVAGIAPRRRRPFPRPRGRTQLEHT